MKRALITTLLVVGVLGTFGFLLVKTVSTNPKVIIEPTLKTLEKILDEKDKIAQKVQDAKPKPDSDLANDNVLNILLIGIDRRSRAESAYRTDIMILLSINPKTNKVLLTSVPRDLWVGGGRINATYIQNGWEDLRDKFQEITGLKAQRFITTDFEDFKWIVDALGGVNVDVETTFTDTEYPEDKTKTYQTVHFTKGPEKLTGDLALKYARSRHGNNGEGSDWMRMKRQHIILKNMVTAIQQPESQFYPMVVEKAFTTVTTGKMDTNLNLADAYYLWDFYKDHDKYSFDSLFLDSDYVYNPPMSDYGGAWVLAPKDKTYATFHAAVKARLEPTIVVTPTTTLAAPTQ